MRTGISITITLSVRGRLEAITRDRNASQKHAWRAAIILSSADGVGTNDIMRRTGKSKTCVWRWQERFMMEGIDGLLHDKTRPSLHPSARSGGGRARGGADACRSAGRDHPLDRRSDGTRRAASAPARSGASGRRTGFSRTVIGNSSSRTIRTSSTSCATWSGSMSIRRPTTIVLSLDEKSQIQALDRTTSRACR